VEYVHYCAFCSWHRAADLPVMLPPHCERCGSGLSACSRAEFERSEAVASGPAERVSPGYRVLARAAVVVLVGVVLALAARAGYEQGGPALALAAFGGVGLFTVPPLASRS
jgi:hypothetical protein